MKSFDSMKHYTFLIVLMISILLNACSMPERGYVIGVSQCSDDEWREQMNEELRREALFYRNTRLDIRSVKDDNEKQIADIQDFIRRKVDLIIVSPNEANAITPVIEKAYDEGIPVVLVDRKIHSTKYTAFVGADNYEMGYQAGCYIANRLHGRGRVAEVAGLTGATSAIERHNGFMEAIKPYPDIQVVTSVDAGWLRKEAYRKFADVLRSVPNIDMVFVHNDRMATGAYEAAVAAGREQEMRFVGMDAMSGKDFGVEQIMKGNLDASFIYPTGGDKVLQVAMAILQGKKYEKETKLSTALVDKDNARILQMQDVHLKELDGKIELIDGQLDKYLMRYSVQRIVLVCIIGVLIVLAALLFFVVRAFWTKKRISEELAVQKRQVEEQRDQLVELSKRLEKATHAKLAFFTNVSHDFRTPLTLIADPVEQLEQSTHLDEHERSLLRIVQKNVTVLLRLINQILDFRKFENDKLEMHLSQFDLAAGMKEWTEAFRAVAQKKHIRFRVNVVPDERGYTMVADEEKLERITYNLLSNAFKFTPESGLVEVQLSRFTDATGDWISCQVSDSGVGMLPEHVKHVFDDFYQADVHYSGSGIGLALVKAFTEMHGGNVTVDSAEGKGSIFTLHIPMKQAGEPESVQTKTPSIQNLKEGAVLQADQETLTVADGDGVETPDRETVLVIDDNQDVREYVRMLLSDKYTVIEASNGQEGLQQAMKHIPDAIICDVMMPVMDGMECCRRLKAEVQTSHIPVMMLTAYAVDEQKVKGYECGADSYISKPFSAKLLLARLRNLIENRKRLQNFFSDPSAIRKERISDVDRGFAEKLRGLIEENLTNPELTVEDLGAHIGMGRVQLYRKAKALTGYGPNELLRMARLKKAAVLLASTDKTVAEVSYAVGFSAPSYFTKCYKEYFGESPTDFLKRKGS